MTATPKLRLGDSEVARIGLGTNRLANTAENVALIEAAVAAGVQLIDTAHTYAGGESEETIGAALSQRDDGYLVATKGGWNGASPDVLREEIDESLRRLRTDSIGLYYLHRPDPSTRLEESLRAIGDAHESGKIRRVGISNVTVDEIERARRVVPVTAVQNRFSLADRTNDDVVDYCGAEGIAFVAYFPLRRVGGHALATIAERRGVTEPQVALAWLLKRSPTVLPIPGTLSPDHLKENLAALELQLSDAEYEALL